MATMKAARWHAAKDVRIEEVEVPEVQPHQVKVAVKFTGICGTDLHEYLDELNVRRLRMSERCIVIKHSILWIARMALKMRCY